MGSTEYGGDWSWDSETLTKASGFLKLMTSFEFAVSFCIAMRLLSSLRGLTVKLQKKANDILVAYELISEVQFELELLKVNCEKEFTSWFEEIEEFANDLSIPVTVPRISSRQVHRSNIPAESPEVYYRRNVMIPFLDHILVEMENRFGEIQQTKVKLLGLIPSTAVTYAAASISEVGKLYESDLPSPQLLTMEFD